MSTSPEIKIHVKKFDEFLNRVLSAVDAEDTQSAFTLIIGCGFSNGLIPTAKRMALYDIPWWRYGKRPKGKFGQPPVADDKFEEFRKKFWAEIYKKPGGFKMGANGLPDESPDNVADMYRAVMSDDADKYGLNTPEQRTKYLRDVVKRSGNEINYAHLFLAGILQAQNTSAWFEKYGHRRPFCRTVLTTNFDALLQRALQINDQMFYVSDRPEASFDDLDDEQEAIHIVQAHGSIFRLTLLNTGEEIHDGEARNVDVFAESFRKRSIIVIGYGGWNDAIMCALEKCADFRRKNLYWCDIFPLEKAEKELRKEVVELLKRKGAFYVPLPEDFANGAMQELHKKFGLGKYPQFIANPLASIIESVKSLKLPADKTRTYTINDRSPMQEPITCMADADDADAVKQGILEVLEAYQDEFNKPQTAVGIIALARVLVLDGYYQRGIQLLDGIISTAGISDKQKTWALVARGGAKMMTNDNSGSIEDCTRVIDAPLASAEHKTRALTIRSIVRDQTGDDKGAIEDYTFLIDKPNVTINEQAFCLVRRGINKRLTGNVNGAIDDYTRVIDMPETPVEQKARALIHRGIAKGLNDDINGEIDDMTYLIKMPDAPAELKKIAQDRLAAINAPKPKKRKPRAK